MIVSYFPIGQCQDPIENRYCNAPAHSVNGLTCGKLLTSTHVACYSCITFFINTDTVGYVGFVLSKRTQSGVETNILGNASNPITIGSMNKGSSAGVRQVNVAVPLTSLNPTDCIVIRYYAKSTSSNWVLMNTDYDEGYSNAVFSTPQLNAQDYGGNTETLRAFMQVSGISGRIDIFLYIGYYTTVATGILNFQYTLITKSWHDISTWNFNIQTRKWSEIVSWMFQIITRKWNDIITWTWQITTYGWHVTEWIFIIETIISELFPFIILVGGMIILAVAIYYFIWE